MRLIKTPSLVKKVFNGFIWNFPDATESIYLTFDDGPVPEVTPWVLSLLNDYDAKATFFCIGRNVEKYPDIYNDILKEGHSAGNHTYSHAKGWETKTSDFIKDVDLAGDLIDSNLFRPPYGKLKQSQIRAIKKDHKIIMWDVLSYDFDKTLSKEKCLDNVISKAKGGSIVVFHDSKKAEKNLKYVLPRVLEHLKERGFKFCSI